MAETLTLEEARALVDRAVEKGKEVGWITSWAVTDQGGNLLTMCTMDGSPPMAIRIARAKAHLVAVTKGHSKPFADRMLNAYIRYDSYDKLMNETPFAGPGGFPIIKNGECVGGISSSNQPAFKDPVGNSPIIDGVQSNREDYVTCYALEIPYANQH